MPERIGRVPDRTDDSAAWWSCTVGEDIVEGEDGGLELEDGGTPDVAEALVPYVDHLRERSTARLEAYEVHAAIYEGLNLQSFDRQVIDRISAGVVPEQQLNFAKNVVDSIHVKVTKNRPRVKAVCSDADWSYVNRARKLTRALASEFDHCRVYEKTAQATRASEVDGDGVLKVFVDWDNRCVGCEVVPASELFVDETESRYGTPRQIHQVKQYSRDELIGMFPEHADAILDAPASETTDDMSLGDTAETMVDVYESWRLPTRRFEDDEMSDGRRAVCVKGKTLLVEEYRRRRFPFPRLSWREPLPGKGFWGSGVIQEVQKTQWEIDKLVGQIQYSLKVGARTKFLVSRASEVNVDHLAHPAIGAVIEYGPSGAEPKVVAPDPVSAQLFSYLQFLIDKIYQTSGMSQDAASSEKPAGLNSGIALLHFHDFQTEKFLDQARRLNDLHVEVAELFIDCMRELAEEDGYRVRWSDGNVMTEVDWADVDMERDRFVLKLEAVSDMPDSHAGRLNIITQFVQNGQVPQSYVNALFENPDVPRMNRMLNADHNYASWLIERLSDHESPQPDVDPSTNTELCIDMVRSAYADALTYQDWRRPDPVLQEVLDRFRDWLDLAAMDLKGRQPPPSPASTQGPQQPGQQTVVEPGNIDAGIPPMPTA